MSAAMPRESGLLTRLRGRFGALLPCLVACFLPVLLFPPVAAGTLFVSRSPIDLAWAAATGPVDHYNVYLSFEGSDRVLVTETTRNACRLELPVRGSYLFWIEAEDARGARGPLSDASEEIVLLQPVGTDTDNDGMPDEWEVANGLNPRDAGDAEWDKDGDGLINVAEFYLGTDAGRPDTDLDGVSDGDEVLAGTNPSDRIDQAPVAVAGKDLEVAPTRVVLDGTGSHDPNGDPLTYRWCWADGTGPELSGEDTATPSFLGRASGQYRLSLVVSDGKGESLADDVTVTVLNVAPQADSGPDRVLDAGMEVLLDGGGSLDANGDPLSYFWFQIAGPKVALQDRLVRSVSFVPLVSGVYRFWLVVSDGKTVSQPDEVQVLVHSTNEVPTADAGEDRKVSVGEIVTLDGSGSVDPDDDALSCSWSQVGGPEGSPLENPNGCRAECRISQAGNYTFQLVVTDGKDASQVDSVSIIAEDENLAPFAVAVASGEPEVGNWIRLSGSLSHDQPGDKLTYRWTQRAGPFVSFSDAQSVETSFCPLVGGVYRFALVVSDGELESLPAEVEILVRGENQIPVADAGEDSQASVHQWVALDGTGSYDNDSESGVAFIWAQAKGPRVTLYASLTANPCFMPDNPGLYRFTLVVSDGELRSPQDSVEITVNASDDLRPVAVAGGSQFASPGQTVLLDGTRSFDPENDHLEYHWFQMRGPAVSLTTLKPGKVTFVPGASYYGTYCFILFVFDGVSWSDPAHTFVLVPEPGKAATGRTLLQLLLRPFPDLPSWERSPLAVGHPPG